MQKISKKQKLIGIISIAIITIILVILITKNIISNNNQVANEKYLATTANAGSNLIASYIQKGVTIGGITGTLEVLDTSDATATPEDIAKGKTAYVNGVKITGTYVEKDTLGTVTGNETENSYVNDKYGNQVVIPAGFKVVNPNDDVTKGIVIEDVSALGKTAYTKGSQFVWIPVGDVIIDSNGNTNEIELGRYSFASDTGTPSSFSNSNYTEDTLESHNPSFDNAIARDIEDFIKKTETSHGYYIGRYEAGDATATTKEHTDSGTTNPITCKSGVYPYTYLSQSQASSLCKEMYNSSNFESDLINSYSWDTAILFIQTFSGDTNFSCHGGSDSKNHVKNPKPIAKCGETTLEVLDDGDDTRDFRCNISDMAGNASEWSTETNNYYGASMNSPYIARGGCNYYKVTGVVCSRGTNAYWDYLEKELSTRPIIYLE